MHQPGVRKASWGHFGLSPSLSSPQDASDMVIAGRLKLSTVQPLLLLLLLQLLMLLNTNTCNCYYSISIATAATTAITLHTVARRYQARSAITYPILREECVSMSSC